MSPTEPFVPFVVFGASKSGTTWLQKTLDAHPDLRCHFQLQLFPFTSLDTVAIRTNVVFNKQTSPFKGVFKDAESERQYWLRLKYFEEFRRMSQKWVDQLKGSYSKEADQAYVDKVYYKMYRGLAREMLIDVPGKKIYGTKSYSDLEFLFKVYPEAKVISIIRDGRDVATSKRFHYWKMGAYYHGEEKSKWLYWLNGWKPTKLVIRVLRKYLGWFGENYFERKDDPNNFFTHAVLKKMARDWFLTTRYILNFKERFPDQIHLVRYEEMKKNQEGCIQEALEFLGADADPAVIQEIMDRTDFNRMKKDQKDSFFRKGVIGDWQNHFNEGDKALFKEQTEGLLVELGYEKDNNW
jgi:hypothetical protein